LWGNVVDEEQDISTVSGGDKHNGDKVEDRYYTGDEYRAMSADEKNALFKTREARGHVPGAGKKKGAGGAGAGKGKKQAQQRGTGPKEFKKLTRQVAKLAVTVAANSNATNNDDSDDDSSEDAAQDKRKGNKNRNNDALTRQKAPRKK
jgi:hypothetical protein